MGLTAKQIGMLMPAPAGPDRFEVMPENWQALRVFLACRTQWRRAGMEGRAVGLDYAALPAVAGMMGVVADADLLVRVQVLEDEALEQMPKD